MEPPLADPFSVQRRLRNLQGLAVRYLDVSCSSSVEFGVAFSLGLPGIDQPYFVSEAISNTRNPTWEETDQKDRLDDCNLSSTTCVLQLFEVYPKSHEFKRILCWELDMRVLFRVGEDLDRVEQDFPRNTVIFLLESGIYVFPDKIPKDFVPIPLIPPRIPRKWCSSSRLKQLLKLEKDLLRVREKRRVISIAVEEANSASVTRANLQRSIEATKQRVESFRLALRDCRHSISILHLSLTDRTLLNHSVSSTLESNQSDLVDRTQQLVEFRSELTRSKEDFREIWASLRDRRCELVSGLKAVYPVHRSPSGRVFIVNIWLPMLDQFGSCDDTTLSVSLGCVTHLLLLLSRILNVPLRYPLRFLGSSSSVINQAVARLFDREREFPLHTRARERNRFLEGVHLLNNNVIQLRLNFGLGTQEIKKTLENIQSLMQDRFQAKPPRAPSFPLPQSPAPGSQPPVAFPLTLPTANGHNPDGTDDLDGAIPPLTPAVIFPVQSAPDFGKITSRAFATAPDSKADVAQI